MEIRERVGANLRNIRLRAGVSQEELALRANLERAYVGGIERAVRNPTISVLQDLAAALHVDPREFLMDFATSSPSIPPQPLRRGRKPRTGS